MNRSIQVLLFGVLFTIIVVLYILIYHKYKKQILAIIMASTLSVLLLASTWFLMPFSSRATISDIKTANIHIDSSGPINYAICEDGTKYRINTINAMNTSGFESYKNNKQYQNEKVTISYRYNYKLWWLIPAHSEATVIRIYMDSDEFYDLYGCQLDEAVIILE